MSIEVKKGRDYDPGLPKHSVYDHNPKVEICCHCQTKKRPATFAGATDGSVFSWAQKNEFQTIIYSEIMKEHKGPVFCLLPLENYGRTGMLATGSADCTIKIWTPWDVAHATTSVHTYKHHGGSVLSLAYFEGYIYSSSSDNTVLIYKVQEINRGLGLKLTVVLTLEVKAWIKSLHFGLVDGPRGSLLDSKGYVHWYNPKIDTFGRWIFPFVNKKKLHDKAITHGLIVERESYLLTVSFDNRFKGVELRNGSEFMTRANPNKAKYTGLGWNGLHKEIILVDCLGFLQIWKMLAKEPLLNAKISSKPITGIIYDHNTDRLVYSVKDSTVLHSLSLTRPCEKKQLIGHTGAVLDITCLGDERDEDAASSYAAAAAAASGGGSISSSRAPSRHNSSNNKKNNNNMKNMNTSSSSSVIGVGSSRSLAVSPGSSARSSRPVSRRSRPSSRGRCGRDDDNERNTERASSSSSSSSSSSLRGIFISPYKIFTTSSDNTIRCWDPYDNSQISKLTENKSEITSVIPILGTNQPLFATGHDNGSLRIWNLNSNSCVSCRRHTNAITALTIIKQPTHATGKQQQKVELATCSYDSHLGLWDCSPKRSGMTPVTTSFSRVSDEELLCVAHCQPIHAVITAGTSRDVIVWNTQKRGVVGRLQGHKGTVTCLEVDENIIFSASTDLTIRIWDSKSLLCLNELTIESSRNDQVSVLRMLTPLGCLVSGTTNGKLMLWNYMEGTVKRKWSLPRGVTSVTVNTFGKVLLVGLETGEIYTFKAPRRVDVRKPDRKAHGGVERMLEKAQSIVHASDRKECSRSPGCDASSAESMGVFLRDLGDLLVLKGKQDGERAARRAWGDARLGRLAALEPDEVLLCM